MAEFNIYSPRISAKVEQTMPFLNVCKVKGSLTQQIFFFALTLVLGKFLLVHIFYK